MKTVTRFEDQLQYRKLRRTDIVRKGDYISSKANTPGFGIIPLTDGHNVIGKKVKDLVNFSCLDFYRQVPGASARNNPPTPTTTHENQN